MRLRVSIVLVILLGASSAAAADVDSSATRALIGAAVSAKLGPGARVDVEVLHSSAGDAPVVDASPLPGGRIGMPARFVLTLGDGRRATAVARISADAGHVVARRNLARNARVTADDVEWVEGSLEGQLLQPLPALAQVVGAQTKRPVASGEVLTAAVLTPADAVRANDPVTLVIRRGPIEVRGTGRAISSGVAGDTIRVLRPGSQQPMNARIVEPGIVEIVK